MDKLEYFDNAKTVLQDTYEPLHADPSKTTTNRINQKLKQLKDKMKLTKTIKAKEQSTMQPT